MKKVPAHLKQHLRENEQIEAVHFNKNGEWVFIPREAFPVKLSRGEALALPEIKEEELTNNTNE